MKLRYIQPDVNSPEAYLKSVAQSVGCKTKEEVLEFLNPCPPIHNIISLLPDYKKAKVCLKNAIQTKKKIVIFGDYDCDGITALVQLMDILNVVAEHKKYSWFIPDRMADDYGLTLSSLKRCIKLHNPQLLICVDCGSNSINEINWLKEKGIGCIVIDHHEVISSDKQHPALAHLNPKAFNVKNTSIEKLAIMSASGLSFLFCEQYAKDESITKWNRNRSLLLAGLGTLVDVMPLVDINRALLKHSLRLANDEKELGCIPGLIALRNVSKTNEVNSDTYGFQWGPRLNALGRLEDATISVKLLLSETVNDAEPLAEKCNEANTERKKIQDKILSKAIDEAKHLMNIHKDTKVIILNNKDWHIGVVGIVASKIKDKLNRPAIICGWQEENECWKGSGRSIFGFDLGEATNSAVKKGILLNGGGHKMACGLSFHNKNFTELQNWMNTKCHLTKEDFLPVYTILGNIFAQSPEVWVSIYKKLGPFGNGNPKPSLYTSGKLMWSGENKIKEDVWSIRAGFCCDDEPDKLIYFTWKDIERARDEWQKGFDYQMVLNVSESVKESPDGKKIYYNWYVEDCELV